MPQDRLSGLDFLRAVACLMVIMHHLMQRLDPGALTGTFAAVYPTLLMGAFGVAVFFLLSGFLLTRPFWLAYDAGAPMPSLKLYALRRAARIVPGYYAALLVGAALGLFWFREAVSPALMLRFATGLLFLGELHPATMFPINLDGPLWSIGFEVFSYAALPLVLLALFGLGRRRDPAAGRIVFLCAVLLALLVHALIIMAPAPHLTGMWANGLARLGEQWFPAYNPVGFFVVFAMGGLTAGLSVWWKGRHWLADLVVVAALVVAVAVMHRAGARLQPEAYGWLAIPYAFPWFQLAVAAALLAFPHTRLLPAIADSAPVVFLARISFGVYIWHMLIIVSLNKLLAPGIHLDGMRDIPVWGAISLLILVLALIAGTFSWYLIERPALEWARRLEKRPRPAPVQQVAEIVS
jgi:peptidoglycan/LPS O-acetylase OafA/YrhL